MGKSLKTIFVNISVLLIFLLFSCKKQDINQIKFENDIAFFNGEKVCEYDYIWHIDPNGDYDEVKDSPGEYYTGDKPDTSEGIWIAHDIRYFPIIDRNKFYKIETKSDPEWATNYENEKYKNLIFANLPRSYVGDEFPNHMMHSALEAYNNPCLHIAEPGTYELSGNWNGQIFVDLGKGAETDSTKKINLILNNLNVNCTVGPAIHIYRAYECDNTWEERKEPTKDIDLSALGVNIILKDNTKNYLKGANVYRICKTILKKNGKEQKTAIKCDSTLLSAMSFSIDGEKIKNGELYVDSTFEGISSDLHIVFNGGKVFVNSADDGVNANEDNTSILKINDSTLMVNAGLMYQGDGLDSNGYIVIDGGDIIAVADYKQDPGIDAVEGVYINGGNLVALGETATIDWPNVYMEKNTNQTYIFKCFDKTITGDSKVIVVDENGDEVYTFSEIDNPHISSKKRPFVSILISNPKIIKNKKYDVVNK